MAHSGGVCYFLSILNLSFLKALFRKDEFPFGIVRMKIYHRSNLILIVIPPGGFYTTARMPNVMEIEKLFSYSYSLTYGIFKKFNKNNITCKESLNFREDNCKLNQVYYKISTQKPQITILLKISKRMLNAFNCLTPWLDYFTA